MYEWSAGAERDLRKLPPPIQREIIKKIDYVIRAPEPLRFAEPLAGGHGKRHRFRVRDYRLIFELSEGKLLYKAS